MMYLPGDSKNSLLFRQVSGLTWCSSYVTDVAYDIYDKKIIYSVGWVLTLWNDTHTQEQLSVSNSLPCMADMADHPTCPLGATDTTDDSEEDEDEDSEMDDWEPHGPQSFNPHSLCEWWPPQWSGLAGVLVSRVEQQMMV